jgi:uncharacterized protein YmfQ (DUF2313 family)|nr:MAG TPA: tail protein [Caudoviricetes sp.]
MIRKNEVDILRYLPDFLSKDSIFKNVSNAQSKEHERLRLLLQDLLNNLFIETATWGLKYWEEMLDISSNKNDYQTRRAVIYSRLNNNIIVNLKFFTDLVNLFVVDKLGKVIEQPKDYSIDILIPDNKVISFEEMNKVIRTFIPAHLAWRYIAYIEGNGKLYFGGMVSRYMITNINANNGFDIKINGITKNNVIGIVHTTKIINIPANYYE